MDDDEDIRRVFAARSHQEGYHVGVAADGEEALRKAMDRQYDLVVLDILLPGLDGFGVCRRIREMNATIPIIMLTARDAVTDRVAGLDLGADDYLVKPFAFEELLARIRVCLRRRGAGEQPVLNYADLRLNTDTREVWRGERVIALTATEYELLRLFLQHPRQVLTRDIIYERVWGYDFGGESRIIEVYVRYLREKLEMAGEPRLIQTLRGAGYALREEA